MTHDKAYGCDWSLVPAPVSLTQSDGVLALPCRGRILLGKGAGGADVFARQLIADIEHATGLTWDVAAGEGWRGDITLCVAEGPADGSYALTIDAAGARVEGRGLEGVRNGVQTLRQIIRQCAPDLPCLTIEDKPVFALRGYYLDVTRGRVPTLDWLKRWADELCLLKYNHLQLYVEHTMAFDGLGEVWRGADPLSAGDIMAFDRYCRDLGIELVPSVSTFGHHYTALRSRSLRALGEFPEQADRPFSFVERMEHHTLNVTEPEAFEFSTRLIDRTMELFASSSFNICADETFDLGKGASAPVAAREGVAAMYADYATRLCDHVAARGREPMMWADIAVKYPEILDRLPRGLRLLNWQYSPEAGPDAVALVAASGARQIVCPAVLGWNSLLGRTHDAWRNIARMARYGAEYGAEGILVTDWGDFGHVNDPRVVIPAMAFGGACAWCGGSGEDGLDADEAAVSRAVSQVCYGDRTGAFVDAVSRLKDASWFDWGRLVEYLELDDGQGGVNLDVLGSLRWQVGKRAEALETAGEGGDLAAVRRIWLTALVERVGAETIAQADGRLDRARRRIGALMPGMCDAARTDVGQSFLVGLEGQKMMNRFGAAACRACGVDVPEARDMPDAALAEALDKWFATYATQWRKVSRESELRRIGAAIARAADSLR